MRKLYRNCSTTTIYYSFLKNDSFNSSFSSYSNPQSALHYLKNSSSSHSKFHLIYMGLIV